MTKSAKNEKPRTKDQPSFKNALKLVGTDIMPNEALKAKLRLKKKSRK